MLHDINKQIFKKTAGIYLKLLFFKWENNNLSGEKQKINTTIFTNDHIKVIGQFSYAQERVTVGS